MMRALLVLACLLAAGALLASQRPDARFPHEAHERLFPVCEGCHQGVVTGVSATVYPQPMHCARCHDGARAEPVAWQPRSARPTNLSFEHTRHVLALENSGKALLALERGGRASSCEICHAAEGARGRMRVDAARPELCLRCHARDATSHYEGRIDCSQCHVPLVDASALPVERLAAFPRPASHDSPDFLSRHAPGSTVAQMSCTVCHARETCERCHANAGRVPAIAALGHDARVAELEAGRAGSWPEPASHRDRGWEFGHGKAAHAEAATCANCHTQPGCTACHIDGGDRVAMSIAALPAKGPTARSARLDRSVRARGDAARALMHAADFASQHGRSAASGALLCAQCHTQRHCAECHSGADSRAFHPLNFVERHATDAFARGGDCQSCHGVETFCRECHTRSGLGTQGRLDAAFHTGQGVWLLAHGQAARTGLESCASCHRQTDCVQCHSAAGGWGVNPHGPDFAASRLAARNRATCALCHLSDPMERNSR